MAESKPFSESLMCHLTDAEIAERADKAARLQYDADKITSDAKLASKAAKDRVEKIEAERRSLLSEVRTRQGYKPVECLHRADYARGKLETIRTDTGEAIRVRDLTPEERQKKLFPDDAVGGSGKKKPEAPAAEAKEEAPPATKGKRTKADAAPAEIY